MNQFNRPRQSNYNEYGFADRQFRDARFLGSPEKKSAFKQYRQLKKLKTSSTLIKNKSCTEHDNITSSNTINQVPTNTNHIQSKIYKQPVVSSNQESVNIQVETNKNRKKRTKTVIKSQWGPNRDLEANEHIQTEQDSPFRDNDDYYKQLIIEEANNMKKEQENNSGLRILQRQMQQSQTLQQQQTNRVPRAVPVFLDPQSYNGHLYAQNFVQNKIVENHKLRTQQLKAWLPGNQKPSSSFSESRTAKSRRNKLSHGNKTINYYNQNLVADYQRLKLLQRFKSNAFDTQNSEKQKQESLKSVLNKDTPNRDFRNLNTELSFKDGVKKDDQKEGNKDNFTNKVKKTLSQVQIGLYLNDQSHEQGVNSKNLSKKNSSNLRIMQGVLVSQEGIKIDDELDSKDDGKNRMYSAIESFDQQNMSNVIGNKQNQRSLSHNQFRLKKNNQGEAGSISAMNQYGNQRQDSLPQQANDSDKNMIIQSHDSNHLILSDERNQDVPDDNIEPNLKDLRQSHNKRFRSAKQKSTTFMIKQRNAKMIKKNQNLRIKTSNVYKQKKKQEVISSAQEVSHYYSKAQLDGIKTMAETGNFKNGISQIATLINKDLDSLNSARQEILSSLVDFKTVPTSEINNTIKNNKHSAQNETIKSNIDPDQVSKNRPKESIQMSGQFENSSNRYVMSQISTFNATQGFQSTPGAFASVPSTQNKFRQRYIRKQQVQGSLNHLGLCGTLKHGSQNIEQFVDDPKSSKMRQLLSINSQGTNSPSQTQAKEAQMCQTLNENKIGHKKTRQLISKVNSISSNINQNATIAEQPAISGSQGITRHESLEQTLNNIFRPELDDSQTIQQYQEKLKDSTIGSITINDDIGKTQEQDFIKHDQEYTLGNDESVKVVSREINNLVQMNSPDREIVNPEYKPEIIEGIKEHEYLDDDLEGEIRPLAENLDAEIDRVLKSVILEEEDGMDESELNERLFNRLNDIYAQMHKNYHEYGYAKSPDFRFQRERVQREQEKHWLRTRGKTVNTKTQHQQKQYDPNDFIIVGQDRVQVKQPYHFSAIPESDARAYREGAGCPRDALKYDTINDDILEFCSSLFLTWLEDYEVQAAKIQHDIGIHHHYYMNEGVQQNIKDQCLPMDYFVERMFQLGLVARMPHMKLFIEIMLQFDNAGWTDQGPDVTRTRTPPPCHRVHGLKLFEGEKAKKREPDGKALEVRDDFKHMNIMYKEATKFLRQSLDAHLFQVTDRVSLSQFLSLFNVRGPKNARKLDRLVDILKERAIAYKEKQPLYERLIANPLAKINLRVDPEEAKKAEKAKADALRKETTREADVQERALRQSVIKQLKAGVSPQHRKMAGLLAKQIGSKRDVVRKNFFELVRLPSTLNEFTSEKDDEYYNKVIESLNWDIRTFDKKRYSLAMDNLIVDDEEADQGKIDSIRTEIQVENDQEELEGPEIARQPTSPLSSRVENEALASRAQQIQKQIETVRKKTILAEVIEDMIKTKEIVMQMLSVERVSALDPKRRQKLEEKQRYHHQFIQFVVKGLRQKYMASAGLYYKRDEIKYGKSLLYGANRRMGDCPRDYGIQARTLIMRAAVLMIQHGITLDQSNYKNKLSVPSKPSDPPAGEAPSILGWLIELNGDKFQNRGIAHCINKIVNLVLNQMDSRESTVSFPNEHAEYMMSLGGQLWEELDTGNSFRVRRDILDQMLCKYGVVNNYKEVDTFLRACLSGEQRGAFTGSISRSQFMKIIYKGVLRDAVLNILTFNKIGLDSEVFRFNGYKQRIIPFSHQIQKFQRFILYCGIKTKNSKGVEMRELQDFYDYSEYCMEVINNLQKLKFDKSITLDGCKIKLENYKEALKKRQAAMQARNYKASILEVPRLEQDVPSLAPERKVMGLPFGMRTLSADLNVNNQGDQIPSLEAAAATKDQRLKEQQINEYVRRLIQNLITAPLRPLTKDNRAIEFWQRMTGKCIGQVSKLNPMQSLRFKSLQSLRGLHLRGYQDNLQAMSLKQLNHLKTIEFGSLRFEAQGHGRDALLSERLAGRRERKSLVARQKELLKCCHHAQTALLAEVPSRKAR